MKNATYPTVAPEAYNEVCQAIARASGMLNDHQEAIDATGAFSWMESGFRAIPGHDREYARLTEIIARLERVKLMISPVVYASGDPID